MVSMRYLFRGMPRLNKAILGGVPSPSLRVNISGFKGAGNVSVSSWSA